MGRKLHTVVSRSDLHRLKAVLPDSKDDLRSFRRRYRNVRTSPEPLYAVPHPLIDALEDIPDWLSDAEVLFERELSALCDRHHALGFFSGRPIHHHCLSRPSRPVISQAVFRTLGWDRLYPNGLKQFEESMEAGFNRLDPVRERQEAYCGWLLCNPTFLQERNELRARWGKAVCQLGQFPEHPVRLPPLPKRRRPRDSRDVTDDFCRDFNTFYDRWQISGLATWDLPQPRGVNLSGLPEISALMPGPGQVAVQISPVLPLPSTYPLQEILHEAQQAELPSHLRGWLKVREQQHTSGLRFARFRHMFLIHFFRDCVLASRYATRFPGQVEQLDRALGQFLGGLGEDSIKKLRRQMASLKPTD